MKSQTQALETHDITLMSNVTSITIIGEKISQLGQEVHVTFAAKNADSLPCVLKSAEEIGLILQPEDAVQIGLCLLSMGLAEQQQGAASEIQEKIKTFLANLD